MFCVERVPSRLKPRLKILALGSDTRQRISWSKNGAIFALYPKRAFLCASEFYLKAAEFLFKRLKADFQWITFDPHPFFASSRQPRVIQQRYFPGARLRAVWHHVAHLASYAHEVGTGDKFAGVALDGTGFGMDRNIWGGEFFVYDGLSFKRAAHFDYQRLPGNESAIKEPWRAALAILYKIYGEDVFDLGLEFLKNIPKGKLKLLTEMLDKGFNAPQSSSVGRLFDAASALLNICTVAGQEAEAAIALEKAAVRSSGRLKGYPWDLRQTKDGLFVLGAGPLFEGMVRDLRCRRPVDEIAYRFHVSLAEGIKKVSRRLLRKEGLKRCYFSGGVFMNDILCDEIRRVFGKSEASLIFAARPMNTDLGISQGQLAACMMERPCV